ncbi:UNVERIFIED_CONTAM: tRNA pseudouridine38-40 synthase [Acetivibrio alkalicellulosi]
MRNIKITIKYDGSKYRGWQRLGDSDKTIQGKVENVLSRITGEKIEIIGSGRTDAGAHAFKQVANFHTKSTLKREEFLNYCNIYLPEDIVVYEAEDVNTMFHARFHAKSKKYVYRVWNDKFPNPFLRKYTLHVPEFLDIDKMALSAKFLIGEHDFSSFSSLKSKKKSMIKHLYSIDITKEGNIIEFVFYGNGFLYNMVRIMTGTLLEIGFKRIEPQKINDILIERNRSKAGPTVPSNGLALLDVQY